MKGNFEVSINQMLLDETLKAKRPYAVLVVSTTGLDDKEFDKNSPTRVQLVQYEFDSELRQYSESIKFDHLVAADIEAVNRAIEKAKNGDYDVFANAEIDVENYKSQIENPKLSEKVSRDEKVLSQADFKKSFSFAMQSLLETNTTVIANGYEHTQTYLDKIGCGEELKGLMSGGKVIDQPALSGEYFKSIGKTELVRSGTATLDNVRKHITKVPAFVKILEEKSSADEKKDFEHLSKDEYIKKYSEIPGTYMYKHKGITAESKYDEAYDYYNHKITAPERVQVIRDFVKAYGQENRLLEGTGLEKIRQSQKEHSEYLSERGKEKYKKASLEDKLKIQEEMGVLNKDSALSEDSDYFRLVKALHGDLNNKGAAIVHIATSGLNNPRGNETGLPLEFHYLAFNVDKTEKGNCFLNKKYEVNFHIQLPRNAILKAEKEAQRGGFDVFKDAGIDIEAYKNAPLRKSVSEKIEGKANWTQEAFVQAVDMLFKKFTPEDYPLIVMGGGKNGDERAFFQRALCKIGNLPVVDAPYIDFTSAVKDYSCLVSEGEIPENIIFGDEKPERMGIRDIANTMGIALASTVDKVDVLKKAVTVMYNQYLSLNKDQDKTIETSLPAKQEAAQEAVAPKEEPKETLEDFTEIKETEPPTKEEIEAEKFADENGYDDVVTDDDLENEEREKFFSDPESYFDRHKVEDVPNFESKEEIKKEEQETEAVKETTKPDKLDVASAIASVANISNVDMTGILNAFIEQSRIQAEQNKLQMTLITELTRSVLKQEETYKELLQQQGEVLKSAMMAAFSPSSPIKNERPRSVYPKTRYEAVQEKNLMERLDEIKDNLFAICNEDVPEKAIRYIKEATGAITDGQKILSKITDKTMDEKAS